ncbi:MAG: hypothetical protein VXZ57_03785, partial [Bacteroidota bacterium]|nr:hypothetical protein [Bacteroidota bacterium]
LIAAVVKKKSYSPNSNSCKYVFVFRESFKVKICQLTLLYLEKTTNMCPKVAHKKRISNQNKTSNAKV